MFNIYEQYLTIIRRLSDIYSVYVKTDEKTPLLILSVVFVMSCHVSPSYHLAIFGGNKQHTLLNQRI